MFSSHNPKISVCIPSYNHAKWLPMTIDSILGQTYRDFEIVIADDGSTDGSLEIAREYAARYPDIIRVFTHPNGENRGISATANLALTNSRGIYWAGIASDDMYYRDALEVLVRELDRDPRLGIAYGRGDLINAEGMMLEKGGVSHRLGRINNQFERLLLRNVIAVQCAVVRRQCFDEVGLFDERLVYQDWEIALRIVARWKVRFVGRTVTLYRRHSYNTTLANDTNTKSRLSLDVLTALRERAGQVGGDLDLPRSRALIQLEMAYYLLRMERHQEAEQKLRLVHTIDPFLMNDYQLLIAWFAEKPYDTGEIILRRLLEIGRTEGRSGSTREERALDKVVDSIIHFKRDGFTRSICSSLRSVTIHPIWVFTVLRKHVLSTPRIGHRVLRRIRKVLGGYL